RPPARRRQRPARARPPARRAHRVSAPRDVESSAPARATAREKPTRSATPHRARRVGRLPRRREESSGQALPEQILALFGTLATFLLRLAEELGEFVVAVALGVTDVGLQPQRVAQTRLDEPDDVVVLVLRAGHVTGLGRRHLRSF